MVPEHDPATELSRTWEPDPAVDEAQLQRELAARLGAGVVEGRAEDTVASPRPDLLRRAVVTAHAEDARAALERARAPELLAPTPWAGALRDPAVLALLGERYGDDHVWSASQLEAYAACPFLFLVERVLRLRDVAEATEETDMLTFGSVAHQLLERFWARMKDRPPARWDLRVETEYAEVRDEVLADLEAEERWTGLPVLWRETWEDVSDAVRAYIEKELPSLAKAGRRPLLVEHGFGRGHGEPVRITGLDRRGGNGSLLLAGRIDRVDRLADGGLAIVDYKTSKTPPGKSYDDGVTLQSALYMAVLDVQLPEPVARAGYRAIKIPGRGTRSDIAWDGEEARRALAFAFSIPTRVREGAFEPVMAASTKWEDYHPGRDVCRTRGALAEGTRWEVGDGAGAGGDALDPEPGTP